MVEVKRFSRVREDGVPIRISFEFEDGKLVSIKRIIPVTIKEQNKNTNTVEKVTEGYYVDDTTGKFQQILEEELGYLEEFLYLYYDLKDSLSIDKKGIQVRRAIIL